MSDETYADLIEKGRLNFQVPRRDVRKWAAYVHREAAARPGTNRVAIIREHLAALDAKSGTMAALAGLLLAGAAVMGNLIFGDGARSAVFVGLYSAYLAATAACAVYAMSALGIEFPEDAAGGGAAAFEFRLLQRLVYRARNHAWGLRSAQFAALVAMLLSVPLAPEFDLFGINGT